MKKIAIFASLLLFATPALATVTVSIAPVSLVTSPITAVATSSPIGLFSFALTADAAETLSTVTVTINANGSSTVPGSHLAQVAVYKDSNANGVFDSGTDLLAGSQTTVNIGSPTIITTGSNNALDGAKFFVSISTASSWTDVVPADSITATLAAAGIATSANSPTITAVTTNTITADTTGPVLTTAVAQNTGGTVLKEAGDSVVLTFNSATNKPTVNSSNINTLLVLNNSHSWLDGASGLGLTAWSVDGKILTVTLSVATSAPTVAVGDTVTVSGTVIKDATVANNATGIATITGDFSATNGHHGDGNDDNDRDDHIGTPCTFILSTGQALINGELYKTADSPTVYLASNCKLKPFRGMGVFRARGHKFHRIHILDSLSGFSVSNLPALPANGTLVKGSDKTIWFVGPGGKRRGFASEAAFLGLGFHWGQVDVISDSDLQALLVDTTPISNPTSHPDGAIIKCLNSSTVFQINGDQELPFTSLDTFQLHGHDFSQVASIDCGKFHYVIGAAVQ